MILASVGGGRFGHELLNCVAQASQFLEDRIPRSEEHTSELQSLTNLVCRLLLEKKKKQLYHSTHRIASDSPIDHAYYQ